MNITKEQFDAEVLQVEGKVLVDFYADWCGPCKMLSPVLEELEAELDGQLKVVRVNVDEEAELALTHGVQSIPALFLYENGEILKISIGYSTKEELRAELGL